MLPFLSAKRSVPKAILGAPHNDDNVDDGSFVLAPTDLQSDSNARQINKITVSKICILASHFASRMRNVRKKCSRNL